MKKILVTGANGFIGQSICEALFKANRLFAGTIRSKGFKSSNDNIEYILVDDIGNSTNWKIALKGVDCIIHCAGRAHILKKIDANEKKKF